MSIILSFSVTASLSSVMMLHYSGDFNVSLLFELGVCTDTPVLWICCCGRCCCMEVRKLRHSP
jgi:hypothetical protein